MSKAAPFTTLTALMLSAALNTAHAGPEEDCLQQAAKNFHPGVTYLAHKKSWMTTGVAFSAPATLTMPTSAKNGLHPIFTKSTTGLVNFSLTMPTVYFYDRTPASLNKEGGPVSDKNIDDIGLLISSNVPEGETLHPDEARSYKATPQLQTFVETVRSCLKPS